jgi:hypothetical protein
LRIFVVFVKNKSIDGDVNSTPFEFCRRWVMTTSTVDSKKSYDFDKAATKAVHAEMTRVRLEMNKLNESVAKTVQQALQAAGLLPSTSSGKGKNISRPKSPQTRLLDQETEDLSDPSYRPSDEESSSEFFSLESEPQAKRLKKKRQKTKTAENGENSVRDPTPPPDPPKPQLKTEVYIENISLTVMGDNLQQVANF